MVANKNSTTRRKRRPKRQRAFREDDGRPDMGRLKRRRDEFTQTLLQDERLGKLKDITDLPAEFWPIVQEIEATCYYYWRPMHEVESRN
jgi:hypothetical protein